MLSLIAAMSLNGVIGKQNRLPWHLPVDLAHFKAVTMGKKIVMGRKTSQSIAKPLPGRTNIVLSTNPDLIPAGFLVLRTIDAVVEMAIKEEIFVVGGAEIYQQFMLYARRLYLTVIEAELEGDAYFPQIDEATWRLVSRKCFPKDDVNPYRGCFLIYER